MKKTAVFFGSNTGDTANAAKDIAKALGINDGDIFDVSETAPSEVAGYQNLILGTSTWGDGELQSSWEDFIAALEEMDLKDKTVALFGCGDGTMADTFCDGVGELYDRLQKTGATFVGEFPTTGLDYDSSKAVRIPSVAVGLLLDNTNHADLTPARIAAWTEELSKAL